MNLFDEKGPRLFHIPPTADFGASVAHGLKARAPADAPPEAFARVTVFTNTRRAARSLLEALRDVLGPSGYAPDIRVIGELGADPRLCAGAPSVVDPLVRRLGLTRIVRDILERAQGRLGPVSAALPLADLVAALVDELQEHRIDIDALEGVAAEEHGAHWEISRLVLQTAQTEWRAWAEAHLAGAQDPAQRLDGAIDALIGTWRRDPPVQPIIAAGSTASRPGAARLLTAIANLPQGAVILPGFDVDIDEDVLLNITAEHPQSAMLRFLGSLDASSGEIQAWRKQDLDAPILGSRTSLVAEALRPAPVTDAWRTNSGKILALSPSATAGLSLIEAPDSRQEAEAAAFAIRQTLADPSKRVMLVTPDRSLARRVVTELSRFGVEADDSGGRPLSLTPPGVFARLLADFLLEVEGGHVSGARLLALLKHPICASGPGRGAHLTGVRCLEIAALRRATPAQDFGSMRVALNQWAQEKEGRGDRAQSALSVLDRLESALGPISQPQAGPADLSSLARALRRAAWLLSASQTPDAAPASVWDDPDGEAVLDALRALEGSGGAYGPAKSRDFAQILNAVLQGETARTPIGFHPRLSIFGPLEARLQTADRIVLAGLDEGVWPEIQELDPWFSRPMRAAAGLPEAERRIGLAAHDFSQAMGATEVILTRALKRDGAATVPSRWLQRLTNLLQGAAPEALAAMRRRGEAYQRIAMQYTAPTRAAAASRPAPMPAVSARPRRLSVTRIETLIRDPYAIYADRVLGLRAVDPIGQAPDARERGSAAHRAVELFIDAARASLPDDPWPLWRNCVSEALQGYGGWPAEAALWERRLSRIAPWFLSTEASRRVEAEPVALEASGILKFQSLAGDFTLSAKADRIDRNLSGNYSVYDYKTGAAPTEPQVAAFAKQLPLEAAILESGGFEGLAPAAVDTLAYLRLGGDGEEKRVDRKTSATDQASQSLEQLKRLIATYDDPSTPYLSRTRPERIIHASDYDHLARVAEWDSGEGGAT